MYKSLLTTTLIALTLQVSAQEFPKNDLGKYEFSEVINVEGANKEQIFRTARHWMNENFGKKVQGDDVIQVDDSYLGEMMATPLMWVEAKSMGKKQTAGAVSYSISISAKEGKYKFTISNFYHEANRSTAGTGGALENDTPDCGEETMKAQTWIEIKASALEKFNALVADLKTKMAVAGSNSEGDW